MFFWRTRKRKVIFLSLKRETGRESRLPLLLFFFVFFLVYSFICLRDRSFFCFFFFGKRQKNNKTKQNKTKQNTNGLHDFSHFDISASFVIGK